jgi:hypothetical protein
MNSSKAAWLRTTNSIPASAASSSDSSLSPLPDWARLVKVTLNAFHSGVTSRSAPQWSLQIWHIPPKLVVLRSGSFTRTREATPERRKKRTPR